MSLALLIAAIVLFLAGAIAGHEGELLGLTAMVYLCVASACFAAAHLPLGDWIGRRT